MLTLRYFRQDDAGILRQNQFPHLSQCEVAEMICKWDTKMHNGKRFEMFAIQVQGRIVGSISLYSQSRTIASAGIFVFSHERKMGYACTAMCLLAEHASAHGYRALQSQIRTDNAASIRLHEKLGYETDGYIYKNHRDHEVLIYFKCL